MGEFKKIEKIQSKKTLNYYLLAALKYKKHLSITIIGCILTVIIDYMRPFIFKNLFDILTLYPTISKNDLIWQINKQVFLIAFLGIVHNIVWRIIGFTTNFFQPRIISNLMKNCFDYTIGHSRDFFENHIAGSLTNKLRRFSYSFEMLADQASFNLGRSILMMLILNPLMFYVRVEIGVIVTLWQIIYAYATYKFAIMKLPYDLKQANTDSEVTAHASDAFSNHSIISAFGSSAREMNKFSELTDKLFQIRKKCWTLASYTDIFQGSMMLILEVFIFYYCSQLWLSDKLTVGDFAFMQSALLALFSHIWDSGRHIRQIYEALSNANEMTEILDKPHHIVDVSNAKPLQIKKGVVEFVNVKFAYPANYQNLVLDDFSLQINPNQHIAFVGHSGAGKTTITKLLLRELEINDGCILIDNQNIAHVTRQSLCENIVLVPQDASMFNRSIFDNIAYSNLNASHEQVVKAAKAAYCDEFIMALPQGYKTMVGEKGVKLSGGQRQRIAIARAILSDAKIVILDEATSSLDSESEGYIQLALHNLLSEKTVIAIAHRLSTIKEADVIYVLSEGKIIEHGNHDQLLRRSGQYAKYFNMQAGGFIA